MNVNEGGIQAWWSLEKLGRIFGSGLATLQKVNRLQLAKLYLISPYLRVQTRILDCYVGLTVI